jgi:hypothetical protein
MIESEFGQEVLEAEAPGGALPTTPLVLIDDLDPIARPAKAERSDRGRRSGPGA